MLNVSDKNALGLMNANKCQYAKLSTIFSTDSVEEGTEFNIIVDMNKLFEGFRRDYQKNITDVIIKKRLDHNVAAEVINWVVHYRRFFNRLNCKTVFYLVYGNTVESEEWVGKYKAHSKYLNFIMEKRIKPLISAADNINVINTTNFNMFIHGLASVYVLNSNVKKFKKRHTLIISDDEIAYQLLYQIPNSLLLKLNFNTITPISNIFDYLSKGYKSSLGDIPNWYINIYLALMGVNDIPPISLPLKKMKILQGLADFAKENYNEVDISASLVFAKFKDKITLSESDFIKEYEKRLVIIDIHVLTSKLNTYALTNLLNEELDYGDDLYTNNEELQILNNHHYGDLIETTYI